MFVTGLAALGIAFAWVLLSFGIDGRPDDVIIEFGGHRIGGPADVLRTRIAAFVAGTVGVICVLRSWKHVRDARFGRVVPGE